MISDQVIKDLRDNLVRQSKQNPCNIPVTITREALRDVPCYWLHTAQSSAQQVILYLHGGSNIMGSIDTHKGLVTSVVDKTGVQALFVEYSLAPEHPFPQGFQEVVQVYEELLGRFLPKDIVVMGDSAGGQQGLALLLKLKENKTPLPAAYVGLSPVVDITPETLRDNIKRIKGQDPVLSNPDGIIPFMEFIIQLIYPQIHLYPLFMEI